MIPTYDIDISRLHYVTEHILNNETTKLPRRAGCTTAYLYLMLGEVWMSPKNQHYIYVGKNAYDVYMNFKELLRSEGVFVDRGLLGVDHEMLLKSGQTFKFTNPTRLFDKDEINKDLFGYREYNKVFFDEDLYQFSLDQRMKLISEIQYCGAILV